MARELGAPTLAGFSPAESVGSRVRPRIRAMLLENGDFAGLLSQERGAPEREREDALLSLKLLRECIEDIEKELTWFGHNNPPDVAESAVLEREQFRQALSDIDLIRTELEKPEPDVRAVEQGKSRLVRLATALAKWTGARATKFADATLAVAAPVIVVKVTGLMPLLVNAIQTIARTVSH